MKWSGLRFESDALLPREARASRSKVAQAPSKDELMVTAEIEETDAE
jgi:hypothetical protein